MRDDVGTNEFLVRSGRRAILSNRHTRMQMANLANVLSCGFRDKAISAWRVTLRIFAGDELHHVG